ncbi:lipid A deacylase LpxR family protein [Acidocella sp.]|uniref:lipid A deacylase LpxR family protein n=1 Tax=Acidocella sp. TaxID=50710 RepID=UPI0018586D91|nr:lipid A deacylase LpxR family protein [Acidocella sp.]NNM57450.1 lipid A deacylase LpxR family protein [Acidocella sp.]
MSKIHCVYNVTLSLGVLLGSASLAWAGNPLPDPGSILTVQVENDALSIPSTDELYTSGIHLGYVTPTGALPDFLSQFGTQIFGGGTQRLELSLDQVIFTPTNTQLYTPNPRDMPYSGHLSLSASLIQDTTGTRSVAGMSVGVVGPDALGQSVQNGFHELIGDTPNRGWRYQLHNEPTLDFFGSRIWRDDIASFGNGALGLQVLPQVSAQAGNTEIYAQAGGLVRLGQGLDSDFGPSLLGNGLNGTDAYTPTQPLVWYVFAGADGRLVGHNIFIQGNDFQSSRHVALTPLQGEAEIGAAMIVYGFRITATEVLESPQFHHSAPAFQYGSIAISGRF